MMLYEFSVFVSLHMILYHYLLQFLFIVVPFLLLLLYYRFKEMCILFYSSKKRIVYCLKRNKDSIKFKCISYTWKCDASLVCQLLLLHLLTEQRNFFFFSSVFIFDFFILFTMVGCWTYYAPKERQNGKEKKVGAVKMI